MVTAETFKKIASVYVVDVVFDAHSVSEMKKRVFREKGMTAEEWVACFKKYEGKKRIEVRFLS